VTGRRVRVTGVRINFDVLDVEAISAIHTNPETGEITQG